MSEAFFDSNILIDALNDIEAAQREINRYRRRFISRVTWIEVMVGALPDDGARAEGFMAYFSMVEVTEQIARLAAALRSRRKRLQLGDAVILASAQSLGHVLITRNTKDFPVGMPGVRVPYTL